MIKQNGKHKPTISYPCKWQYKLIGPNFECLKAVALQALAERVHQISMSNKSAHGKYTSANLVVQVESDEDRNRIYRFLKAHPDIKMVL